MREAEGEVSAAVAANEPQGSGSSATFFVRLAGWNRRMNDIPHKCLLIAVTLLIAFLAVALFPYCWPFVVAMVFSKILEPFVRLTSGWFQKLRAGRSLATLLGMLLLFGLLGLLLAFGINRLWQELAAFVRALPDMMRWINRVAIPWVKELYKQYQQNLPSELLVILDNAIASLWQTLAGWAAALTRWVGGGAWRTAMSIVDVVLSVVLTIMGTYYLTADKGRIGAFMERTFPQNVRRHSALIKTNLAQSLLGQVKSQLKVSVIITTFLVTAFILYGVPYGFLLGLLIGVVDALPVLGAGLFLIPMTILSFVLGDVGMGVFAACIYVGTIIIRQVFEPRIVGKQLGLYPLATMIAMYAGYRMLGFLGLLGGPILLNLVKVVLAASHGTLLGSIQPGEEKPMEAPSISKSHGKPAETHGERTLPNGTKRSFWTRSSQNKSRR